MLDSWGVILTALIYLLFLFTVAYVSDRYYKPDRKLGRPVIYSLSLAIFCTSWTIFGSVGQSAKQGFDFLPVYLGAILMIGACNPLLRRIIRVSKTQNITSIADFISARYGKNQSLAALVTIIAVIGTLPYIALQLKAVSESVTLLIGSVESILPFGDVAFFIALFMATFAVLFGTRQIDATEHQAGLIMAIAIESIVKLFAFLCVGIFVTFFMFNGFADLYQKASAVPDIKNVFSKNISITTWITVTFLSFVCIIMLPRQFHVTVVENNSQNEARTAGWMFPLYILLINIFIVPIAIAGLLTFPDGSVSADMFVLSLPMSAGASVMTLMAFIAGLSAATAMVIVASIALSVMVSNDLVVPFIVRQNPGKVDREDMSPLLLNIRRSAIFIILILGYLFFRMIKNSYGLASIGLIAFSATAQFAPAFFGGLFWRRGTARGAIAGVIAGFLIWLYTLLLPAFENSGLLQMKLIEHGLFGLEILKPQMLFYFQLDPLPHGVFWSLLFNVMAYIGFSLTREPKPLERMQASAFIDEDFSRQSHGFRLFRGAVVTVGDLQQTAARYLGENRAARSFDEYSDTRTIKLDPKAPADPALMRYTEHLLASAIGTASSRVVMSLLLRGDNVAQKDALKLLDDASEAIHYNRDLLQTALDQVRQGISVFDENMRLICWNRQFRNLLNLPPEMGRVGIRLDQIIRYNAERGAFGASGTEEIVRDRIEKMVTQKILFQERLNGGERILEIRTNAMPQGGFVTTYADVTEKVAFAEALALANATLERRVKERTSELTQVNEELELARFKADEANSDKTRFLATASHDILQPLNAARLYTSSLVERLAEGEQGQLAKNIDASLEAVEEILGALLDISRLDAGAMKPEFTVFPIKTLLDQLEMEFSPLAKEKGLILKFRASQFHIRSDRRLLRRVLQNLISNAIKYTERGKVLIGCRKKGDQLAIKIYDTGPGIPREKQYVIFKEFKRLNADNSNIRGLGLGLSIVERIGKILGHPIGIQSELRKGSVFHITLPVSEQIPVPLISQGAPHVFRAQNISGLHVICVDNEPDILSGMKTLLTNWNCTVETALNIEQATDIAHSMEQPPHIILADYHLGSDTGIDAISAIRKILQKDIPAVVITADHSPEVTKQVREMGVQILRKPLKPAQLRAVMAQTRLREVAEGAAE